jgi:glycosyltransferase involved in cell wall biosynthesis
MRILMLTTWFSLEPGDSNLTNDLVTALAEQGHDVQVVLLDWNAPHNGEPRRLVHAPGVDVLALTPRSLKGFGAFVERSTKWLVSQWFARREMKRALSGQSYDLMIGFAMASITIAQILYAKQLCRRSYMILWDFFPYHHRSIGLINNPVIFKLALWLENWSIRHFDVIGCMTPANEAYLKSRYNLGPKQKTEVLPIWGQTEQPVAPQRAGIRAAFGLPADKKIVVFGGTLAEGRGLDDILAAAEVAQARFPYLAFLIIGDGRQAWMVSEKAEHSSNIIYRRRIPRASYLELLTACDAGLVCTVRNVDVPTFPSKTIDYLRAGIPIIASIEASTDYGSFIEANRLGGVCLAGDPEALAVLAAQVVTDPELASAIRHRTRECLERMFDVRKAAIRVAASAAIGPAGRST